MATAKKYATATYGAVFTQKRNQAIGTGDSITAGTGASGGSSYVQKIQQSGGYYQNTDFTNIGVPGETMATMASSTALETQLFNASYTTHTDVLWGGTNDIAVSGATAAATYASLTTKVAALKSAGYKVECVTMLPRGAGNQVAQQAYNTLILANTAGCDSIADPTTNPAFSGATINPADTFDGIHPNNAGYAILAPIIKAALVSLQ